MYTLASDSLQGRKAGSGDAAKARAYIAREWRAMGLQPLWGNSYEMPFTVYGDEGYCNLLALIEGSDPNLKEEYIVIGGHYDHLGVRKGKVYNGADDNASGTACVTEVARQLLKRRGELKRSVIVCAFDAEEMGLHGSRALADHLEKLGLISHVKLMMSVDMVGWLKASGWLKLEGTGTLADPDRLVAGDGQLKVTTKRFETSMVGATDTEPFATKGVPTLYVSTGLKSPYHKPEDDADLIDYPGMDKVTDYMVGLTVRASALEGPLASGKLSPKHDPKVRPFEFGLTVGYNTATVHLPDAAFNPKSLTGGQGGLMLKWNASKMLSLQMEVLYTYTHSRFPDAAKPFEEGFRQQQHAVTVPLALQFGPRIENVMAVYLIGGGYYSRLLSGDFYLSGGGEMPAGAPGFKSTSPNQWGLLWGVGIQLGLHLGVDVRNYYQMNQLWETTEGLPKAFNWWTAASIMYYF